MNTAADVEGSLDILWENCADPRATPKYKLHFARYNKFRNGAQKGKLIVGTDAVEAYLLELGIHAATVKDAIEHARKGMACIDNLLMPEPYLSDYEL
ncbi:MAG: hypothetical protein WA188_11325 [Terriglobales bacterium]